MAEGTLQERLLAIRAMVFDVDGVLSNGQILLGPDGHEWKAFHARDGIGLKCLHAAGLRSGIITARGSPAIQRRADEIGIEDVILHSTDKRSALIQLCEQRGLALGEVAFMGDDLQDLRAMMAAGIRISVAHCPAELAERADYVTRAPGGEGAVREAIEWVLKAQSRWEAAIEAFLP
jgi:3-deoxy-D-manno-octulosonate 8-phosphate phosphatase (KDO 8-P phosphatase)